MFGHKNREIKILRRIVQHFAITHEVYVRNLEKKNHEIDGLRNSIMCLQDERDRKIHVVAYVNTEGCETIFGPFFDADEALEWCDRIRKNWSGQFTIDTLTNPRQGGFRNITTHRAEFDEPPVTPLFGGTATVRAYMNDDGTEDEPDNDRPSWDPRSKGSKPRYFDSVESEPDGGEVYEGDAYPISDPKHPEYHSVHADIWDLRERG